MYSMNVSFGYGDSFGDMYEEIDKKIGKLLCDVLYWDWRFTERERESYTTRELETLKAERNQAKYDVEELLHQAHKVLRKARPA